MGVVKLSVIRSTKKADAARFVRGEAHKRLVEMTAEHGDDFSGFALVTWDRKSGVCSTIHTGDPMPHKRIIPSVVNGILTQHVSSDIAENEINESFWPES